MNETDRILEEIIVAISQKQHHIAIPKLMPLVEDEVPRALGILGYMYQTGDGLKLDVLKSISILEKALALGDASAAHNLGTIYISGYPEVPVDKEKSMTYYRMAKDMGAQFEPDEFYE